MLCLIYQFFHKIPTLCLFRDNICWLLLEYLFHLQVRTGFLSSTSQTQHPKYPHYNSDLNTYTFHHPARPHLQLRTCWTSTWVLLKHFKLYITKLKNLLSFLSNLGSRIWLQVSYSSLLPSSCCVEPGLSPCSCFPMIGITFLLIPLPSLRDPILNSARANF